MGVRYSNITIFGQEIWNAQFVRESLAAASLSVMLHVSMRKDLTDVSSF